METPITDRLTIREGMEELTPLRILTLYRRAPLARRLADPARVQQMFEASSFVLSAWDGTHLVGLARVMTDGVLFSYLCDLAVEPDVQGLGVGGALMAEVLRRCRGTELLLRDSEVAAHFYEKTGFARVGNAWVMKA